MRRVALALFLLLTVATPALGDDAGRKHQIDSKIATLQDTLSSQKQHERALRREVDDYTTRIRSLEARVGDVSLHLQTLQEDLSLHQRRLDALDALFRTQSDRLTTLRAEYRRSIAVLNRRIVDIYESDDPTTLDVLLGAQSVQDALDKVQYLQDIHQQDRQVATEVAYAKAQVTAARKKTKRLRAVVQGETAVIRARTAQTQAVRDELVGARNDLSDTKQQKLQDRGTARAGPARRRRPRTPGSSGRCRGRSRAPSAGGGAGCTRGSTSACRTGPRSTPPPAGSSSTAAGKRATGTSSCSTTAATSPPPTGTRARSRSPAASR
jgi:septal ring factor EnvC (AmiA/AmiB activator)